VPRERIHSIALQMRRDGGCAARRTMRAPREQEEESGFDARIHDARSSSTRTAPVDTPVQNTFEGGPTRAHHRCAAGGSAAVQVDHRLRRGVHSTLRIGRHGHLFSESSSAAFGHSVPVNRLAI
jgi:hypothetical protein